MNIVHFIRIKRFINPPCTPYRAKYECVPWAEVLPYGGKMSIAYTDVQSGPSNHTDRHLWTHGTGHTAW